MSDAARTTLLNTSSRCTGAVVVLTGACDRVLLGDKTTVDAVVERASCDEVERKSERATRSLET